MAQTAVATRKTTTKAPPKVIDPVRQFGGDLGLLVRLMMEHRKPSFLFEDFYNWLHANMGNLEDVDSALIGGNAEESKELLTICLQELVGAGYLVVVSDVYRMVEQSFADHASYLASCRDDT
jgi:hypothetical protein